MASTPLLPPLLVSLLAVSAAGSTAAVPGNLRSGHFVQLATGTGALACPQSLTTLQGIGFCVGVTPLGAAPVGPAAKGADLFLQCSGQHLGPREGSFMLRYPFLRRDAKSGVPVFGSPISLPQAGVLPGNVSLVELHAKVVWAGANGTVLAAVFSSDLMHLLRLHENGTHWMWTRAYRYKEPPAWSPPASSDKYSLVHGVSSVAVSPTPDGGFMVHLGVDGGESTRSNPAATRISSKLKRSLDFQPYGGDGIYRGRMGMVGVGQFHFNRSGGAGGYSMVTESTWTGGLMGLRMSTLMHGGRRYVIGGSRTGLIYAFSPQGSAKPVPLVDKDTGLLFYSRVIGAAPIHYPRLESGDSAGGDEDLIIGGENGVEFVAIERSDDAATPPSARARHAGPVLQEGAALVTGQTPTVSVCDFDHDGVLDIIAGTSEGRIYFARGTTDGYLNPVALQTGEGLGAEEILVQGGYRTDLQGPSESRWGYTAPSCVDWNGDGLMDLVSSDNSALTKLYLRYRTNSSVLALRPAVALMLDGLVLHGTWRNGPAAAPIDGRMALVTSDEQDEMHLYHRIDDHNLEDGGKLWYRVPNSTSLRHIQTNFLHAGGSGRLKYQLVDWTHDGRLDLLLGTCGYHSVPSNTSGLPACAPGARHNNVSVGKCGDGGATVLLMRQIEDDPAEEERLEPKGLVFSWPEWVTVRGARVDNGGQENGIAAFDQGDGQLGLIVATPGGRHVYWSQADLGTSSSEPPTV